MLNYQQQLHSLPVGNAGNFYYAATTMPSAGHNSSGPGSGSGAASLPHPEATYNVQPQPIELEQKLHHETGAYEKDKHVSTHRRELDKMHRFSVDNLIELKQDAYAKSKMPLELSNSFGKFCGQHLIAIIEMSRQMSRAFDAIHRFLLLHSVLLPRIVKGLGISS